MSEIIPLNVLNYNTTHVGKKTMKTNHIRYKGIALATVVILLIPWVAMQFTDEVVWDLGDFIIMGFLLFGTGLMYEFISKQVGSARYRIAVGVGLLGMFLLVWVNGAVGIIGSENNNANMMYMGVPIVGIIGGIMVRFRVQEMARVMFITALAQALVPIIALIIWQPMSWGAAGMLGVFILNAFFVSLFLGSAWLFRYAARDFS